MSNKRFDLLEDFVFKYSDNVKAGFKDRWDKIDLDIYDNQFHECIGALIARQASLTIEMAHAPSTWNGSVGPLFLRCMVDAYITTAWILDKPNERSEKFVHYGLGQEKLYIEHLEKAIEEDPDSHDVSSMKKMVELRKSWLNSQLFEWAIEVDVGSWSGISTREMAKQIGRETIYNYAYAPFSGAAHNMWQHVGIYNLEQCQNPMHKFHNVPVITEPEPHIDFMYRSSKYMTITFDVFDEKMGIKSDIQSPMDFLISHQLFNKKSKEDN